MGIDYNIVRKRLGYLFKLRNLSYRGAARACDIDESRLRKFMNGTHQGISADTVFMISRVLGCPSDFILGLDEFLDKRGLN